MIKYTCCVLLVVVVLICSFGCSINYRINNNIRPNVWVKSNINGYSVVISIGNTDDTIELYPATTIEKATEQAKRINEVIHSN
jgi:hypothetical protein